MQGTNEEAVIQVGSAEMASEQEELEREHLRLEFNRQQAEEALHAAQHSESSDDDSHGGVATLKDVLF